MTDKKFPWIDFPDDPKIGQQWIVRSKVMPVFITWEFRGPVDGWVCIDAS